MALDSVPWFIGGGAEHSPEIARLVAYAATGGAEGITSALDMVVRQTVTPSSSVTVGVGSATLLNKYAGGSQQSYMVRNASSTSLTVSATGSGGGRSDLVILRIDDPQYGGQAPSNVKDGPYCRLAIIQGVSSTLTAISTVYPCIALARVDLPANTAVVTQAMIVQLRRVARPRRTRDLYNTQPTTTTDFTSTSVDIAPQSNRTLAVPEWATQMKVIGTVAGARCINAAAVGGVYANFDGANLANAAVDMDANTRGTWVTSDTWPITAAQRGTNITLRMKGNRTAGTGTFRIDQYTTVLWDVEFLEVPSTD